MKPDLTLLYSELDLTPGCSLEEFQLAYRRRIFELQPNPRDASPPPRETSALLRDLIWIYTAAQRFHRRYGRLPGATPTRGTPVGRSTAVVEYVPPDPSASAMSPIAQRRPPASIRQSPSVHVVLGFFFLMLLLSLGGVALFNAWPK